MIVHKTNPIVAVQPRLSPGRSKVLLALVIIGFLVLLVRAAYLQGIQNDFLQQKGEARYSHIVEMSADRGMITDRNGEVLAVSSPVTSVYVDPQVVVITPVQLEKLSELLEMDKAEVEERVNRERGRFVYLKRQIVPETAEQIRELKIPGIAFRTEFKRYYPEGEGAAHIIGFTDINDQGQEGVERGWNAALTGELGSRRVIKDNKGRVYPNTARRLAPDFYFHDQVYRADGEHILLPPGEFTITTSRGPEYYIQTKTITVGMGASPPMIDFKLERWIHPAARNWYSGDHHVHAAGCAHYENPTEGVSPDDMMRHILGEDLNVGCVLTWGPCWYSQKQYFEGKDSVLSRPDYLMRYDIEVSGFPSSHAGHLCLLRLSEDDYPGTTLVEEWPSWTLPVLDWGKKQGGVVGYSHSGWGLGLPDIGRNGERLTAMPYRNPARNQARVGEAASTLPDYSMPPFDGIGANEFIVAAPHGVCDFISAVDTPAIWELNIWYHTLNCGLRTRISGETDFPCIYGDKVGLGRVYVKLDQDQPLDFDAWVLGLKNGRSYCGDGMSHLMDFSINGIGVGEPGSRGKISQLDLSKPGSVSVKVDTAAMLLPQVTEASEQIRNSRLDAKPYWHIERCRMGDSRRVPVEVIVNGRPVARKEIIADGSTRPLEFDIDIEQSSWVALRILPSVHTNPIFVVVDRQPIRASRKSAEWCIEAVDTCWNSKNGQISTAERPKAKEAYDQARAYYRKVLEESNSL